jgi:hypothetical protein
VLFKNGDVHNIFGFDMFIRPLLLVAYDANIYRSWLYNCFVLCFFHDCHQDVVRGHLVVTSSPCFVLW